MRKVIINSIKSSINFCIKSTVIACIAFFAFVALIAIYSNVNITGLKVPGKGVAIEIPADDVDENLYVINSTNTRLLNAGAKEAKDKGLISIFDYAKFKAGMKFLEITGNDIVNVQATDVAGKYVVFVPESVYKYYK